MDGTSVTESKSPAMPSSSTFAASITDPNADVTAHSKDPEEVSLHPGHFKDAQTQTARTGILKRQSSDSGADLVSTPRQQLLDEDTPLTAEPDALSKVEGTHKSTQTSRIGGFAVGPGDEGKGRKRSHVSFDHHAVTVTIPEEHVTRTEES